jgi:hypothetical protein
VHGLQTSLHISRCLVLSCIQSLARVVAACFLQPCRFEFRCTWMQEVARRLTTQPMPPQVRYFEDLWGPSDSGDEDGGGNSGASRELLDRDRRVMRMGDEERAYYQRLNRYKADEPTKVSSGPLLLCGLPPYPHGCRMHLSPTAPGVHWPHRVSVGRS